MSKSNVNPDHYKVAGRERQGEDIAQARHKQKRAQSLAQERLRSRAKGPKRAPARASSPDAAPKVKSPSGGRATRR